MLVEELVAARVLAIVRGTDPEAALQTVLTLHDAGFTAIEVSLTTADAPNVIAKGRAALGSDAMLGAGTVVTADDAARAADAGAGFIVTPALGTGIAAGRARGLPVLAGAFTPSEVVEAVSRGAEAIKLFPASLGGAGYLRALRDPFPDLAFVPVGGVDAEAAHAFFAVGAAAVGVGAPLVGDAASGGSLDALRERARAFRAEVMP
ncbi:MAG TPA: bifunctional 4-hydroxy-2-oxoglutarate aldolase/2-dehydro-3-deoxy-phosphogluconate aldolase [Jatrophihabitans sp.]|jgi:2-dehydro-3-deoxyphosphogluconate aldolase/(4S)-4-hydroxy-2-oxoglutarate aldolase|nr:bifunctional 4-hydroxy-2-oxoglutarate aldolase/2-dehydro-3-deoxy-phosphogluconate aldolase [Jatrophihabitans sp.]